MNKKILTGIIIIIIGGIWFAQQQQQKQQTVLGEPFIISQHLWPGYYHSYIAKEQGFFAEEGVHVEITLIEDIDANLQAFVDGKADAAFGLQSDAYLLASQGVPLKIIYSNPK